MTPPAPEAPLFVQCIAVCRWCFERFGADPGPLLARTVAGDALRLLDHVTLALKGFDRQAHVEEADAALALLRLHLRLAHETTLLDERQYVHVTGELAAVGRQLGGWLRRLDGAT